jgi:hypothetical protein
MTDGVDPAQRPPDAFGVPHIGTRIVPDVVHDRLVPARAQRRDNLGPDEPGTAGDQYTHTATLGPHRRTARGARGYVMTP